MSAQHTPGPWSVHLGFSTPMGEEPLMIFTNDGHGNGLPIACKEDAKFEHDRAEAEKNKTLIEAAPEMLAALREIVERDGFISIAQMRRARAAIAKATGATK